ncbi:hypothetical protein LguiA_003775 [Lonicera macranthoides]
MADRRHRQLGSSKFFSLSERIDSYSKRIYSTFSSPKSMPTSYKNVFSSPSSACSSPSDSPLNSGGSPCSRRRLTRQRKLRHVSDGELGLRPSTGNDRSRSLPVSPNSGSRSPHKHKREHRSMSAVPQPLPLPEEHSIVRLNDNLHSIAKPSDNLPLPNQVTRIVDGFGKDRTGIGNLSSGSYLPHQTIARTPDISAKSSKSPTYRRTQDQKAESVHRNLRLNVPVRSAPASGFSSPALSPRRYSTVDLFQSSAMVPQEFQTLSPSEFAKFDRVTGFTSSRITPSRDPSPLHSPTLQSPCRNTRSPIALPSHYKSLPGSPVGWPEGNNANVHPLPLPPGVSRPSQSPTLRHIMDKSDGSSKKGQWQKGKLIGRGTYGSVYVAINRETGALCAMKEVDIIPDDSKSAECIKQLEQEIKVLQNLKHPNIVQYYGSETVDNRFCIYLEYIHPGSISNYVREHFRAVTESVVRNFTRHIVSGLAYLHSTKTIHRDIKGANLLVDASGVVKLADFGLAKHLTTYITDLSLKGSPHWMAPEVLQAMMRKDSSPEHAFAVDIWSLGCTVIEMLTGKPPWSEYNGVQAMFSVLNRSPEIPETLSLEGKDFLRCCFQRNPAARPSAFKLLEHPFLRNSHDQNETSHSPREWSKPKDSMPVSPGIWIKHGKLPCNSETSPQLHPETSENGTTTRLSPRSTLEILHSVSSPEFKCSSYAIGLSSISNDFHLETGNNNPSAFLRTQQREIPHL